MDVLLAAHANLIFAPRANGPLVLAGLQCKSIILLVLLRRQQKEPSDLDVTGADTYLQQ